MEKIKIRTATTDDLETLLEFEQGVISAERPFDATLKDGHIHYYDLQAMISADHIELLVAEADGMIVASGYARIEESQLFYRNPQYAYLGFMYVRPAYRGMGINKKIIEALRSWALSKNIHELRLDVYFNNLSAISAYKKIGFSSVMIQMRLGL